MSDDDDKNDLTRIEDLAEFLHDESDDSLFDDIEEEEDSPPPSPSLPSLDDLESDDNQFEEQPSIEVDQNDEESEFSNDSSPSFEMPEETEDGSFTSDEFAGDEFGSNEDFGSEFESTTDSEDENDQFPDQVDQESTSESYDFESPDEAQADSDENEAGIEAEAYSQENSDFDSDNESDEYQSDTIEDDQSFEPAQVSGFEEEEQEQKPHIPQQNFEDLRQFAERISYGAVAQGGNPPFSLVLRGIRYQEDAEDIQIILNEHGLVSDDNQQSIEQGLANGSLLISQISEYSAIYLAHKFRRFDLDVVVGLSDEIHPSQSYDADARGLVSKQNIRQNVHESINLDRAPVKIQNIILSTTPTLEGYTIQEYLSVISHHNILSANEIEEFSTLNTPTGDEIVDAIQKDLTEVLEKHGTHDSEILMPFGQGLETLYKEMADALRTKALKIGANAIVGINYQLTPVFANQSGSTDVQYKVTCLGSAVWVVGN